MDYKYSNVEVHKTDSDIWQVVGTERVSEKLVDLGRSANEGEAIQVGLEARLESE